MAGDGTHPERGATRVIPLILLGGLALFALFPLTGDTHSGPSPSLLPPLAAEDLIPTDSGMIYDGPLASFPKQDATQDAGTTRPAEPAAEQTAEGAPPADEASEETTDESTETTNEDESSDEESSDEEASEEKPEVKKPKKPTAPGIPVTSDLVKERCVACHTSDDEGHMTRISYMRKSPEMWELTVKRMIRLHHLPLEPEEAKQIVRDLSNSHGLTRAEAEFALYDSERRVHWSEDDETEDLRETCAKCHTLGRVFSEFRTNEEWKLLKATHLAMFPLADFQAFRGRRQRGDFVGNDSEGQASSQRSRSDRADRVLGDLAKRLPLFSDSWKEWKVDRREVPLAGTWTILGREISRGDVRGTATFTRVGEDEYETEWRLEYGDGRRVLRRGRGLVYSGYSWRGRSETTAPREPTELREVLLLDEEWKTLKGRIFTGEHHELGMDVSLFRRDEVPRIFGADGASLQIPSRGNTLTVHGTGFPRDLTAEDFSLGEGLTVTRARVDRDGTTVELTVNVAEEIEPGHRMISFRAVRGPREIVLYDTIDYIKILPEEGFSRVGGVFRPKQLERFEAYAYHRGPDKKPWTDDDLALHPVDVTWELAEFPVRDNDDDVEYVGALDAATGVFTPAVDGPNPERRWNANNIGDVYVVATCTLTVPPRVKVLKEPEEKEEKEADSESSDENNDGDSNGEGASGDESSEGDAAAESGGRGNRGARGGGRSGGRSGGAPPPPEYEDVLGDPVAREFRARAHLLVTVPIYVDWNRLEWDER